MIVAVLSGTTNLTAYSNDGTQMETPGALTVGSAVNLHGLLFNDGGTLKLVCDQVQGAGRELGCRSQQL